LTSENLTGNGRKIIGLKIQLEFPERYNNFDKAPGILQLLFCY
jgi:hypothetical protein